MISIWFVFSNGFSDCSVPFVFRLVLVRYIDGRKVQEKPRRVQYLQVVLFEWVVVVIVVIFSRVFEISDTLYFLCVCVIWWPT